MLLSMTGFGGAQGQAEGVEYAVEVRSVNNRYFKGIIRLPESWGHAEAEIEKLVRSRISRGTVTLSIRMKVPDDEAAYRVNTAALTRYVEQLRPLEMDANPAFRIDLGAMLQLPGVCQPPPMEELCQKTRSGLMQLVGQALDALMKMRQEEGKAVDADLRGHCRVIEENLAAVCERSPDVVKLYYERLAARVEELTTAGRVKIDEETLAREVAIYAERCDIAEEISRLTGHMDQFRQALDSAETGGRKLDFIAQEMLREANTIASKANDADIGRAVVEIKTAIDRIKEQVQNVE